MLKGTTEQDKQDKQDCDGDEITKNDTEEPEQTTVNTVAKSLKCNEYVILSTYVLGQEIYPFCVQELSFSHRK